MYNTTFEPGGAEKTFLGREAGNVLGEILQKSKSQAMGLLDEYIGTELSPQNCS